MDTTNLVVGEVVDDARESGVASNRHRCVSDFLGKGRRCYKNVNERKEEGEKERKKERKK